MDVTIRRMEIGDINGIIPLLQQISKLRYEGRQHVADCGVVPAAAFRYYPASQFPARQVFGKIL